jgi:hypothetical protein
MEKLNHYFVVNPNSRFVSVVFAPSAKEAVKALIQDQELEPLHGETMAVYFEPDLSKGTLGYATDFEYNEDLDEWTEI